MLSCPQGHHWRLPRDGTLPSPGHNPRCPTCGASAIRTGETGEVESSDAGTVNGRSEMPEAPTVPRLSRSPSVAPKVNIPGYDILAELGRGGMSVVYKARDLKLERLVAIKMLLAGEFADQEQQARFLNEARALAALRHPHIVQIHEVATTNGLIYLALELVEGRTLAQFLRHQALSPTVAAELTEKLARAVQHAHEQGVLHRDLKPGNVLLGWRPAALGDRPDSGARSLPLADSRELMAIKITDFGLARRVNVEGLTRTGDVLGTPAYMPPEQAGGKVEDIGPAADVYGLGALLYEMLTGRPPFRGENHIDTLDKVLTTDPIPPRQLQPKTPRDLETICLHCLEKQPARRYASASDLADDLRRFLDGSPIQARPSTWLERGVKWVRRYPTRAALLGVSLLAALLISGGIALHSIRLQQEVDRVTAGEQRAQRERRRAEISYRSARDAFGKQLDILRSKEHQALPRMSELQRQQLETMLGFYETLLRDLEDPSPAQRFDIASACVDTARIRVLLGQTADVERLLGKACTLLEELRAEFPEVEGHRWLHATALNTLGTAHRVAGDSKKGEAEHRRAVELWLELAVAQPHEPRLRRYLAGARHCLAMALQSQGRLLDAEAAYREAAAELSLLAADPALRGEHRPLLGHMLVGLGVVQRQLGYNEDSLQTSQRIEGLLVPQLREEPDDLDSAISLCAAYINWGDLLHDLGQRETGLKKLDEAVRLGELLLVKEPKLDEVRATLSTACAARGKIRHNLNRWLEASQDYDRAVELCPASGRLTLRWDRLKMLALANLHTRAADEARDLAAHAAPSAERWFFLATIWAKCAGNMWLSVKTPVPQRQALIKEYEDEALACLAKSRAAGYFDDAARARSLRGDFGSFGPMMVRPEFTKFCTEVEAAAKTM